MKLFVVSITLPASASKFTVRDRFLQLKKENLDFFSVQYLDILDISFTSIQKAKDFVIQKGKTSNALAFQFTEDNKNYWFIGLLKGGMDEFAN